MKYPGLLNKVETKEKVSDVITVQSIKDLPQNSKSGSIAEVTNKGVKKLEKDELLPRVFYIHVTNTDVGDIARTEDNLVLAIQKDLKAAYYDQNHNKKIIPYQRVAIQDQVYREYEIQGDLQWKNLNNITIFVFNKNKTPYIYNGEEWEPIDYVQKSDFVFDSVPTENSSNLLTSGVIYNELSNKADLINGKVPSDQLPSYVDDVIEFPSFQEFPGIGESGKIYIDTSTNSCYRWTGSTYVEIPSAIVLDEYPTQDSENAVQSGGVYSALQEKQDIISDLSEIREGAALGATAVQPEDIEGKQDTLTPGNGIAIDNTDIIRTIGIPFGIVDNTSTSTVFTATVPGIDRLEDGVCCMLKNGVVTSAKNFTININGLGAKPCYSNLAAATRDTTIFNVNYTMMFVYDETRVSGGCWICYRGYDSDSNTNTIGYLLRGHYSTMKTTDASRYYKIFFTSADGEHWVPASVNSVNNANTARPVNQRPIDPFGRIMYTSANTNYPAGATIAVATLWSQYPLSLGYSFNVQGGDLTLTTSTPVYIKCAPQLDGSAIIDSTIPYVQSLPAIADGKIYIFLGIAYSATNVELYNNHPIYYHDGTGIRIWTGKDCYAKLEVDSALANKQDTLVSGDNIRTINSQSLLGSGDIEIAETEEISIDDIKEFWKQYITRS